MNNNLNNYFTTNEFAKICNVTKHTLFHYDKIGIFSPEIRSQNGYRYYSTAQYDTFSVISTLKELGMNLKDIKEYLNKKSPEDFISLMKKEETIINKKIKEMENIKKLIQYKRKIAEESLSIDLNNISMQYENEEYFVTTVDNALINSDEKNMIISLANMINEIENKDIDTFYSIGGMLDKNNIYNDIYDIYKCYYMRINSKDISVHFPIYLKEKGNYLVAYHKGSFYDTYKTYKKIINYINDNKIYLKSHFYEDILLDELSVKDSENYLFKISVMIC